jgi:hypothetical protein
LHIPKDRAVFKKHSSQPVTFPNLNLKFYNEFMDYPFYKGVKPDGTVRTDENIGTQESDYIKVDNQQQAANRLKALINSLQK